MPLPQLEVVNGPYVPLPQSVSKVVEAPNTRMPQSEEEIANASSVILPPSVSEVVDTFNDSIQQSGAEDICNEKPELLSEAINISNVLVPPHSISNKMKLNFPVSEVVNTIDEPALKSKCEVVNEVNRSVQSDSKVPQSVESEHQLESGAASHRNIPPAQSRSQVVDNLNILVPKSDSEVVNISDVPSQDIHSDSEAGDTYKALLPHSASEIFDAKNLPSINSRKSEILDTKIAWPGQSVKQTVIDTLPILRPVNQNVPGNLNMLSSNVSISPHQPESAVIKIFNESLPQNTEYADKSHLPSTQSSSADSLRFVETLKVPIMKPKAIRDMQKLRKSNVDAICDSDDDTRTKLDNSLVEHTSVMRGAIPVLPIALAYFCLMCNVLVPGLGTIFSGMFCLCFGIPRFGVHDGAKHRIGSLVINLLVGCGQLFTVLFCLVGWGWSVWWGVIMIKIARKYRKLKAEAMADEVEAPPVMANNHTRA